MEGREEEEERSTTALGCRLGGVGFCTSRTRLSSSLTQRAMTSAAKTAAAVVVVAGRFWLSCGCLALATASSLMVPSLCCVGRCLAAYVKVIGLVDFACSTKSSNWVFDMGRPLILSIRKSPSFGATPPRRGADAEVRSKTLEMK